MPAPTPTTVPARNEARRLVTVTALLALLIGVPLVLLSGLAGIEMPWSAPSGTPQYLNLPALRVTTGDGTVLRTRLAVDVTDSAARRIIEQRSPQVVLLLESTVAGRPRDQIATPAGMRQLSDDLRERLNGYLAESGAGPARQVIVQDLLFGTP